jgi:hypothetical protein
VDQYINEMRHWDEQTGSAVGMRYAEAFFCHRGHGFSQAPLIQDALVGLVVGG